MPLDDVARYNRERWSALVDAGVAYSRPWLALDAAGARKAVDPEGVLGDLAGKDVLCLAGGGGQQSAAFALLGARVTVLDLCPGQLERDRETAAHYGVAVATIEGDMRDLSHFASSGFDLIWHAHSLNFVPDPHRVFDEAARVLRPGGLYRLECWNPFAHGLTEESWDGKGYPIWRPYADGAEIVEADGYWDFRDGEGQTRRVKGPREFRHGLRTIVEGLVAREFLILRMREDASGDVNAAPGSWEHFTAAVAPWWLLWAVYSPGTLAGIRRRV